MSKDIVEEELCDIIDIAHWFLTKESMSHKKLQKLCYYAIAWHYALYDSILCTNDRMEAWVHGPVSPLLYRQYKRYDYKKIPQFQEEPVCITKEQREFLESVWATYGELTDLELEALTHSESTWKNARGDAKPLDICHNKISVTHMKQYYRKIYAGNNA